jgi:hypothetical protein
MSNSTPSKIPLIVALIIISVVGYYGYTKYVELSEVNGQLAQADNILFDLESENADAMDEYQEAKKDSVEDADENAEKLSSILPADEDLTALTRMLDDFAFENHYDSNPFFISQMSYSTVEEDEGFRVLPISMTVETSERNFSKFLEYVESSGSLESGVRLMSIEAVNIQTGEEEDVLRVQLSVNAYLQSE